MIYLKIVFGIISVLCMVFVGFHIMDFLSWYWAKGKAFFIMLYKWLKGFTK